MDKAYMELAISLAKKGEGYVNPNPLVGAVIVKNHHILGQGWHRQYGGLHAEREALAQAKQAGFDCQGAEIYVTLEPCCHQGKQPPCTDAIIQSGITTVYVGSPDPNPLVAGKGIEILRKHGITVIEHVMESECNDLNDVFFHFIRHKTPYIALKYAMTADGKTATHNGLSKWITSEQSRQHVHTLRNRYTGIMAGIGTVLADNPMLNCRLEQGRHPIRIICDSHLRIPLDCQIVKTATHLPTIIAACKGADKTKWKELQKNKITVIALDEKAEHLNLIQLMQELGTRQIDGILVEGGGTLAEALLREHLVHKLYAYIAPKIFGGAGTYTPVKGQGIDTPDEAWQFHLTNTTQFGDDILLEYQKDHSCAQPDKTAIHD